jgi:hypothetical protein
MFSDEAVNKLMRTYDIQKATELFSTLIPKKVITSPSLISRHYPEHQ